MTASTRWVITKQQKLAANFVGIGLVVAGITCLLVSHRVFPPNTYIDGVPVGWLTPQQAPSVLQAASVPPTLQTLSVSNPLTNDVTTRDNISLGAHRNLTQAIDTAWNHKLTPLQRVSMFFQSTLTPQRHESQIDLDRQRVEEWLLDFSEYTAVPHQKPSIQLGNSGVADSLLVDPGIQGGVVDATATAQLVLSAVQLNTASTSAVVQLSAPQLTEQQAELTRQRAERFVGTSLAVTTTAKQLNQTISDQELISFLLPPDGLDRNSITTKVLTWQPLVNIPPKDARFSYDPTTLSVSEFVPPTDGRELDVEQTVSNIVQYIHSVDSMGSVEVDSTELSATPVVQLAIATAKPATDLQNTNNLGIREVIGFGDSRYGGSIPSRVHNVSVATNKATNIIVKPGEELSFNQALGDVSKETGYQPAYVIRNGMTELGDGGGVCQVSTTLFRAVLNAGLQVTKRLPHSYRVSYYELDRKPGVDATVYSGEVDFRFVNDTDQHILIHGEAYPDQRYMTYAIYGTSDGRKTEIVDHETWGYSPPPAPVYIEDPTMPSGSRKQIDWSAAGINARFSNVIYNAAGEVVRTDTYTSRYRPWSAKYLVAPGEKP